ncbi:hypothetical protein QZH41_000538 [Actinostola sp. cb2023]|nr:hypothetical protein QZH41_000538 [Actinostola sp. cb2023]
MAAVKAKFTVEDVLEEVVTEPGVEGNEEDVPSLAEVLKSSVQEFYPLRSTVDSFTAFRDEAMQALEGVYRNHRVGLLDDSEKILDKPVNVRPAIAAEIMLWLKSIYRRMTGSPRAQNPCKDAMERPVGNIVSSNAVLSPQDRQELIRDVVQAVLAATASTNTESPQSVPMEASSLSNPVASACSSQDVPGLRKEWPEFKNVWRQLAENSSTNQTPISTHGTMPPIYTHGTTPHIYTHGTTPYISTHGTTPPISNHGTTPHISTPRTTPPISYSWNHATHLYSWNHATHFNSWNHATHFNSWNHATHLYSWNHATHFYSWNHATHLYSWNHATHLNSQNHATHFYSWNHATHFYSWNDATYFYSWNLATHFNSWNDATHFNSWNDATHFNSWNHVTHFNS